MRTSAQDLHDEAVEALLAAMTEAGLTAARGGRADLVLDSPDEPLAIVVKAMSVADLARVRHELGSVPDRSGMVVLVADQIAGDARAVLRESPWGYLDRRGALWLRRPGMIVNDTSVAPCARHQQGSSAPIRGRVALGVALRLLMHPREAREESVRQLAATIGASRSSVHEALTRLREHALIDTAGAPLIPELFHVTAAVWQPTRTPVRREPRPGDDDLELGLHDEARDGDGNLQGWVVSGDVGAAASGARIVVGSGAPPDFYVPTPTILRRAAQRLEECSFDQRGATIAVAPSPVVTVENHYRDSQHTPWLHWPIAHPVVIALDLAQDLSRGREILDEWTPHGFERVW